MPGTLLWVNKSASSAQLSKSSKQEEARIRRHVQTSRTGSRSTVLPKGHVNETRVRKLDICLRSLLAATVVSPTLASLTVDLSTAERRSLQFFISRTSTEWSGWHDLTFWSSLALQACNLNAGIVHGLISLAATHESFEITDRPEYHASIQNLAREQLIKCIHLVQGRDTGYAVALLSSIILVTIQPFHGTRQVHRLLRSGEALLDELNDQMKPRTAVPMTERALIDIHLRPALSRIRARICSVADAAQALVISAKQCTRENSGRFKPRVPETFDSLLQARNSLDTILTWGHDHVFEAHKDHSTKDGFDTALSMLLTDWQQALAKMEYHVSSGSKDAWAKSRTLLRIASLFSHILLKTFDPQCETVFDAYIPEFKKMIDLIHEVEPPNGAVRRQTFGIDSGLLDILAFIGSRCRDPTIRRRARDHLLLGQRIEGDRVGEFGGRIVDRLIELEERGLQVTSCHDIPEGHRRRLVCGQKWYQHSKILLTYVAPPYDMGKGASVEEVWISLDNGISDAAADILRSGDPSALPTDSFGPGQAAYLDDETTQAYCTFALPKYYFPIPRV